MSGSIAGPVNHRAFSPEQEARVREIVAEMIEQFACGADQRMQVVFHREYAGLITPSGSRAPTTEHRPLGDAATIRQPHQVSR